MKRVYHPPAFGTRHAGPFLTGMALAAALFIALPLTQYLARLPEGASSATVVDRVPAPPPPPPPPPERREVTAPAAGRQQPAAPRERPPPLAPRPVDASLRHGPGDALRVDHGFGFALVLDSGPAIDAYELSEVDQEPRPLRRPPPLFPHALRREGITGSVTLRFIVETDGRVDHVEVEKSDHPAMERAATGAVRQWFFEPGTREGRPVRVVVRQTLSFDLL